MKWLRWTAIALAGLAVLTVLGDFIYSWIIASRMRRWEEGIPRDAAGVREGCAAFQEGDGETLLLMIHGFNDSPACYRKLASGLRKRGYACAAVRLPGFAEPLERYAQTDVTKWMTTVGQELKRLRSGRRHVVLVGHSLGAAIAIQHLLRHPESADAACLLAPAIEVSSARSPLLTPATWHAIANRLLLFTRFTESPFALDAKKITARDYPYRTPFAPRAAVDQTFRLLRANRGRAKEFKRPLLMFVSPEDRVIDSAAAERFFRETATAANKKRLIRLSNTGHAMLIDHVWPEIVTQLDRFLREQGLGPAGEPKPEEPQKPNKPETS